MGCKKSLTSLSTLAIALCVELLVFSLTSLQVRAQSQITFPPTQPRGAPARTVGGGQRGGGTSCLANSNPPLTALTPNNNVLTTLSANPTLFWYVPHTEAKSAEFVVFDSNWQEVYQTTLAVKGAPGIVKLTIPPSVSLETGKQYTWKLSLICNPENRSGERFVAGVIERTELNLEEKLKLAAATEPLQKVEVYAQAMVWQETLSLLAQLRDQHPNDLRVTNAWRELLSSVKLEAIANQPLVQCCTVSKSLQ